MNVGNPLLTIEQSNRSEAIVKVTFTVTLWPKDLELGGGFMEAVYVNAPEIDVARGFRRSLPLSGAIKPGPGADYRVLNREHTFRIPLDKQGPYTAVTLNGDIEIWPTVPMHAVLKTNVVVVPARSSVVNAITESIRLFVRRLRALIP